MQTTTRSKYEYRVVRYFLLAVGCCQLLVTLWPDQFASASIIGKWGYVVSSLKQVENDLHSTWTTDELEIEIEEEKPISIVHCYNSSYCCGEWTVNADPWVQHHPHWETVMENDTSFCFAPIQNENKTQFLQHVHFLQWGIDVRETNPQDPILPYDYPYPINCSDLAPTISISSGFGASMSFLYNSFWWAVQNERPFQIQKRGPWMLTTIIHGPTVKIRMSLASICLCHPAPETGLMFLEWN